jgi:hypothetical protein
MLSGRVWVAEISDLRRPVGARHALRQSLGSRNFRSQKASRSKRFFSRDILAGISDLEW